VAGPGPEGVGVSARALAVVAAAVVAAVVLALAGLAVLGVSGDARADDRRAVFAAGRPDAQRHERGVGDRIGEEILGVADDRSLRDAVALAKAAALPDQDASAALELRAEAEAILAELVRGDASAGLRSNAANLLGALYFEDAKAVEQNPRRYLESALGAFQDAVRIDPSNRTAKTNLELLATLPAQTKFREPDTPDEASATPSLPGGY
jgi:hypothetical protein